MLRRFVFLFCFGFMTAALAQPVIRSYAPVLNSASYIGPELGSGAGAAQGSIFALFGSGFGDPSSTAQATSFPLPKTLAGTSVRVTVGTTSVDAIMLGVYNGVQINAVLPSSTPLGAGSITVSYGGATSAPAAIQVVPSSFGIYSASSQGVGQAVVTDLSNRQNSIIHTFHPGDIATLWGTGLGAVGWDDAIDPSNQTFTSLAAPTEVFVGNTTAAVSYHGRSGCCAGLDQIVFTVPSGVEGCYVPVGVKAGAVLSNILTIAVSSSGKTCSDSPLGADNIAKLAAGQTVHFGWIRLEQGADWSDTLSATFDEFTPATAALAAYGVSAGYCLAGELGSGYGPFLNDFSAPSLDAGSHIHLSSGFVNPSPVPESSNVPGFYDALLVPINYGLSLPWAGTAYTISNGGGGTRVGPFSVAVQIPAQTAGITNIQTDQALPGGSDLTVQWAPDAFADPNGVATLGGLSGVGAAQGSSNVATELQCTVPVAPGRFTIPAWALSMLEPMESPNESSHGYLWLFQYNTAPFSATGLDSGLVSAETMNAVPVVFQ